MTDDPKHHGPQKQDEYATSELILALVGMVGSLVLLLLVTTGVIHQ